MKLEKNLKVYVSGHMGLVGAGLLKCFNENGFKNILVRTRGDLDLSSSKAVDAFFEKNKPDITVIAAAKVGGIAANMNAPVEFLVENLQIQNNLLLACHNHNVAKTLFLGSSCIYPRDCKQPMREEYFMTGQLEPTNESYAIAKIAGIRLAQAMNQQYGTKIICLLPCNIYGPNDHFDLERSHVVSALVKRFIEAKRDNLDSVKLWGDGSARREFLHVDDLANACMFLLENVDSSELLNVGSGEDLSIKELAQMIAQVTGYQGKLQWDTSKPNGMPQKLLDVSKLRHLGWFHKIDMLDGLKTVVKDFENRFTS